MGSKGIGNHLLKGGLKMDFGDILAQWEKQGPAVYDKDAPVFNNALPNAQAERRSRLLRKKPDAFIDLHGLGADEAWIALKAFFEDSRLKGLEKVLVIHGKGNHLSSHSSQKGTCREAVLPDITRRFIESCSYAGESGHTRAQNGGSGATWVILKQTD
jgi:DNA-nicking Smr family endonuclease